MKTTALILVLAAVLGTVAQHAAADDSDDSLASADGLSVEVYAQPDPIERAQFVAGCVSERNGPPESGGLSDAAATALCESFARIHDAVEMCERAIVNACVEQAKPTDEHTCTDEELADEFAATCFPRPDDWHRGDSASDDSASDDSASDDNAATCAVW